MLRDKKNEVFEKYSYLLNYQSFDEDSVRESTKEQNIRVNLPLLKSWELQLRTKDMGTSDRNLIPREYLKLIMNSRNNPIAFRT